MDFVTGKESRAVAGDFFVSALVNSFEFEFDGLFCHDTHVDIGLVAVVVFHDAWFMLLYVQSIINHFSITGHVHSDPRRDHSAPAEVVSSAYDHLPADSEVVSALSDHVSVADEYVSAVYYVHSFTTD